MEGIPKDVRKELEIIPAKYISDVLKAALETEVTAPKVENFLIPTAETNLGERNEPLIAKEK